MRLGRILVVVAAASVPAVVTLIGCGVQGDRYPGLPNEVPNSDGTQPPPPSSGSSSSGSTSTSSSGGLSLNICQCALTFLEQVDGGATCNTCGKSVVAGGGACFDKQTACDSDPACQAALVCIPTNCTDPLKWDSCVATCMASSPVFQDLATCQCTQCQKLCAVPDPINCDLGGDAGSDAGDAGDGG